MVFLYTNIMVFLYTNPFPVMSRIERRHVRKIVKFVVEFNKKSQILLHMQLKRKIVKFVKFVTAFDPGHKCPFHNNLSGIWFRRTTSDAVCCFCWCFALHKIFCCFFEFHFVRFSLLDRLTKLTTYAAASCQHQIKQSKHRAIQTTLCYSNEFVKSNPDDLAICQRTTQW